jgi:hypothetical protein
MSTTNDTTEQTYRIETKVSAGTIEDPVTGEKHDITDDGIEVSRADSAAALVNSHNTLSFAGSGPTDDAIHAAQTDRFEFAESDVCMAFADDHYRSFEEMNLDPANGFDPEADPANNDPRMKATKAYNDLQEHGHESEAAYLRALPTTVTQEEFVAFVREEGLIENE